jgi:hypothetical protein
MASLARLSWAALARSGALSGALSILAAARLAAQLPVPGAPCSAHGTGVLRIQVVDPRGQVPAAHANAVIVALRCGAMMDSLWIAELRGVPEGRHLVQVRVVGFPPESVRVAVASGDTVRAPVRLRPAVAVRAESPPPAADRR